MAGEPEPAPAAPVPPGPEALGEETRNRIRNFALRLTGDEDLAEDTAQETLARALREGVPRDLPYLLRVALNLVRSELRGAVRRRRAHAGLALLGERSEPGPLETITAEERKAEVWQALGRVPEKEREALVLRFGEGMGCGDIARVLGMTPNAVSCHLRRGKDRMKGLLAERSRR